MSSETDSKLNDDKVFIDPVKREHKIDYIQKIKNKDIVLMEEITNDSQIDESDLKSLCQNTTIQVKHNDNKLYNHHKMKSIPISIPFPWQKHYHEKIMIVILKKQYHYQFNIDGYVNGVVKIIVPNEHYVVHVIDLTHDVS